jgi:hypothetical protein
MTARQSIAAMLLTAWSGVAWSAEPTGFRYSCTLMPASEGTLAQKQAASAFAADKLAIEILAPTVQAAAAAGIDLEPTLYVIKGDSAGPLGVVPEEFEISDSYGQALTLRWTDAENRHLKLALLIADAAHIDGGSAVVSLTREAASVEPTPDWVFSGQCQISGTFTTAADKAEKS